MPEGARSSPSQQTPTQAEPQISTTPEATSPPEGAGPSSSRPASILDNGKFAAEVLAQALLPEYREVLINMGGKAFFHGMYASLAQVANSIGVLREVISEGKGVYNNTCSELEVARAEASSAREEAEKAREEAKKAQEEAEGAMIRAMEASAALEEEKRKGAEDLQVAFDRAEGEAARAEEEAARAEEEAARAEAAISQVRQAEDKIDAQDRRVAELSQALEESEVRRARESSRAEGLQARVLALEAAAEARASSIIEEFRGSKKFEEELGEATSDAYMQGFDLGKTQVAKKFNLPAALDLEMELDPPAAPGDSS